MGDYLQKSIWEFYEIKWRSSNHIQIIIFFLSKKYKIRTKPMKISIN